MKQFLLSAFVAVTTLSPLCVAAQDASWARPVAPFRIAGNVYYVGTEGLSAYLITSGRQAILLDATLDENALLIEHNIKALGIRLKDVKIILNSHAHYDHAGAIARLKRDTGAQFYASAGDLWALEHGTHDGETIYPRGHFPAAHVDRVLSSGEVVALSGVRLKATVTAGHTRGCTTWATQITDPAIAPQTLNVVFPCSVSVAGNILDGNKTYPQIVSDYEKSFDTLDAMKADIVLTNHPEVADVLGRASRVRAGDARAFVDLGLLHHIISDARVDFESQLAKAKAVQAKGGK